MPNDEKASAGELPPEMLFGPKWEPPAGGDPQRPVNPMLAKALGISPDRLPKTETAPEGEPEGEKPEGKPTKDKRELDEEYQARLQKDAEEAFANAAFRLKEEGQEYLDKLVHDPSLAAQRIAKKLLENNDFGAKTVPEYKKLLKIRQAGDRPEDQRVAQLESRLEELEQGGKEKDWQRWKEANGVSGKASQIANDVHSRFPDMEYAEVMETTRGKLGVDASAPMKIGAGVAPGGAAVPQEEKLDFSTPLARRLIGSQERMKANQEFAKKLFAGELTV